MNQSLRVKFPFLLKKLVGTRNNEKSEWKRFKGAVRKYVFFQSRANWAFDGVFRATLVSEDAFSLCEGSS